jgi:DnaJ-domain-containing protein 1
MIWSILKLAILLWCICALIGLLSLLVRPALPLIAAACWLVRLLRRPLRQLTSLARVSLRRLNGEGAEVPKYVENLFDPHAVLGVSTDAPPESIKAAYRELIKRNHPDLVASLDPAILEFATERTKQIHRAFEMIGGR